MTAAITALASSAGPPTRQALGTSVTGRASARAVAARTTSVANVAAATPSASKGPISASVIAILKAATAAMALTVTRPGRRTSTSTPARWPTP